MRALVTCAVCCLVVAGCGKKAEEKAIEKMIEKESGGKAKVDLSEHSLNIETKDGSLTVNAGKSAKIPEDFPADVPIFKPSTIEAAMSMPKGHTITLLTDKAVSAVSESYKDKMPKKGWSREALMDMAGQTMIMFKKGKRVANVTLVEQKGKTRISLTVATE